jgi:hypothetical protein
MFLQTSYTTYPAAPNRTTKNKIMFATIMRIDIKTVVVIVVHLYIPPSALLLDVQEETTTKTTNTTTKSKTKKAGQESPAIW